LGEIVDAFSHSTFWKKMAIFVVEDDAQNGVDHVDGHRTVALVISPYIRRGAVDSTFYSHPSILKTIELMLGLPTLSDRHHAFGFQFSQGHMNGPLLGTERTKAIK
jgi:hypothetical protein